MRSSLSLCLLSAALLVSASQLRANTAADWNAFSLKALAASQIDPPQLGRIVAIEQIAVYEAANATRPTYVRSVVAIPDAPNASTDASIAEASYRTLLSLAPAIAPEVTRERNTRLARIPNSPRKTAGIAAGDAAAAAVLQWRANDGADFTSTYTPGTGAGAYLPTSSGPVFGPHISAMKPLNLASYSALRPPPPPPLDSPQMRRDLEEVRMIGGKDSTLRTRQQTASALFHAAPGVYAWSSIARQTAAHLHLDEVTTARLLALVETTLVDSACAIWDAKYAYNLWRPITALQAGAGPLQLTPLPHWTPLTPTPMFPEYPCAHCGIGAAVQVVLEGVAGDGPIEFAVTSGEITRHYHSFREFAAEESISRLYAGVHFRWSIYVGESMGRQIGEAELKAAPRQIKPQS